MKKFKLGQVVMTRGINDDIAENEVFAKDVLTAIQRYASCDWGDTHKDDKPLNDEAVENGDRVLAAYNTCKGKIWIISEADRSYTTILYPEEY